MAGSGTTAAFGGDLYPRARQAWAVVIVLLLVGITSYLDRMILSLLVDPIKTSLDISDTQVSLLQGSAFALFYVAFGLPFGTLVDRASRRTILAVGVALWSFMTFACGLAVDFWTLFLARAGVGIGEACLAPAAFSLIADYFAPQRRGRPMSIYNMSNYLGSGASLLVGGALLRLLGGGGVTLPLLGAVASWRAVFFLVALPGLILALMMLCVPEPTRKGDSGSRARPVFADFLAHLLRARIAYGSVYAASALIAFAGLTFAAWSPSYFVRIFQLSPASVGLLIGPASLVGGVLGCLVSGILGDRLVAKGSRGGRFVGEIVAIPICLAGIVTLVSTDRLGIAVAAMGVVVFGSGLGIASIAPTIHDITPNRLRGRAVSLHFILSGVLGMGLGPTLIALVTDHVFHDPLALGRSLAFVLTPVLVAGLGVGMAGRPAYDAARRAAGEAAALSSPPAMATR